MSGVFSRPKVTIPQPPPAPTLDSAQSSAAMDEERKRRAAMQGKASTILTNYNSGISSASNQIFLGAG